MGRDEVEADVAAVNAAGGNVAHAFQLQEDGCCFVVNHDFWWFDENDKRLYAVGAWKVCICHQCAGDACREEGPPRKWHVSCNSSITKPKQSLTLMQSCWQSSAEPLSKGMNRSPRGA